MVQDIYIIDDDKYSLQDLKQLFADNEEYRFVNVSTEEINKASRIGAMSFCEPRSCPGALSS